MLSTASKIIKSTFKSIRCPSCDDFFLTVFVVLNILSGFIATTLMFISAAIKTKFLALTDIIPQNYESYLQIVIILALLTIILFIYGCHGADNKSTKTLTTYLVLTSVTFVAFLIFIANYLFVVEETVKEVGENYENLGEVRKFEVDRFVACEGSECKGMLLDMIEKRLRDVLTVCSVVVGLQLLCKFVGSKVLHDLYNASIDDHKLPSYARQSDELMTIHVNLHQV